MQRHRRLNIGDSHFFCHLPFSEKPTVEHFERFIATVHANCRERKVQLVVIDPLINVLPEFCENNPDVLLPALQQFRNLADRGIAVLILHHPKNDHANTTTPRGCGVLPAFVDALMNLDTVDDADFADRRRRLRFASRFDVPRSDRLIILNEAGTDYQELPNEPAAKEPNGLSIVEAILAEFEHPLTSTEIMDNWPERNPSPHPATLRRWLDRLVTAGRAEKFEPTKGNAGRWGAGAGSLVD